MSKKTMASRLQLAGVTLALLIGASIACAAPLGEGAAAPNTRVSSDVILTRAAGPGKLFLGGNLIEGPWTLAYDHGRFTVNGLTLRPPPPPPPPTSVQGAQYEFLRRVDVLIDSLNRSALSPVARGQRLAQFLESNDMGIQVKVGTSRIETRFPDGARISFALPPRAVQIRSLSAEDRRGRHAERLSELKGWLEGGHVVFILDKATTTLGQRSTGNEIIAAIESLWRGEETDSPALRSLGPRVRGQLVKPLPLENIW